MLRLRRRMCGKALSFRLISTEESFPSCEAPPRRMERKIKCLTVRQSLTAHRAEPRRSFQLRLEPVIHNSRVCLALRCFHHLADEETEQSLFTRAIAFKLLRARSNDFIDNAINFAGV